MSLSQNLRGNPCGLPLLMLKAVNDALTPSWSTVAFRARWTAVDHAMKTFN